MRTDMADLPSAPRQRLRQRRRRLFVSLAIVFGLCFALGVLELSFRLFWEIPPAMAGMDHVGLFAAGEDGTPMLAPGFRGELQYGDGAPARTSINSLGLRGPEAAARSPGQRRVLVVGDSLPFGYGVEDDQTFPFHLESRLRATGVDVVVGNAGVPGTGVSHAVARMRLLDRAFAPDAFVICSYLGNDAIDDALPARAVYGGLLHMWPMCDLVETSWRTRLAFRSRLAMWAEVWIFTNKPQWSPLASVTLSPDVVQRAAGLPPDAQRGHGLFLDVRDRAHAWAPGAAPVVPRLLGYLRASLVQAMEVAAGRPVLFVILPTSAHVDTAKGLRMLQAWQWDPADYEPGLARRRWQTVAEDLGIAAFDVTPSLRGAGQVEDLYLADGGHFSVRGNELVGQWLASEVARLLR